MKKEIEAEHPTLRIVRRILTVLLVIAAVSLITVGVCFGQAARGIDTHADLELLQSFSGSRTTRLYCHRSGFDTETPISEGTYDPMEFDQVCGIEDRVWLSGEELPKLIRDAFIAIEDRRFYRHDGVDWIRTARAVCNSVLHFDARFGGSTITQQLIKNVSGEREATISRKLREILRATALERSLTKDEILTYYLNIIPLANRCYGVGAAARYYFGKSVGELTAAEAATIAAITNAPARYDPVRHPEENRQRRNLILTKMAEYGYLGKEEAEAAKREKLSLSLTEIENEGRIHNWYTETVVEDVISDLMKKYDLSSEGAAAMVYGGGLRIHTLCCLKFQDAADRYFARQTRLDGSDASGAFVLIDPRDGALLAIEGMGGKKSANRILNYATDVLRPPGSALKPIALYAPALREKLIHYATVFEDIPEENLWPHNTPSVYDGRVGVYDAVARSKNTVAVKLYRMLGAEKIADTLRTSYGITSLQRDAGGGLTDYAAAPLALGQLTYGTSLLELTGAYTAFASDGVYARPRSYLAVYDESGRCLLENRAEQRRVLSPEEAYIMTALLEGVTEHGTASSVTLKSCIDTAGKTGTSGDSRDRWFIGYTPYLLGGVLVSGNGGSLSGSGISQTVLWDDLMRRFHDDMLAGREDILSFRVPSGIVWTDFCADSGRLPSAVCSLDARGARIRQGPFTVDNMPREQCTTHVLLRYDTASGKYRPANDGFFSPLSGDYTAALDDTERRIPEGVSVSDRQYDLSVMLSDESKGHPTDGGGTRRWRFPFFRR